ncbi:hypothetical protein JCM5350_002483 [Sporobolomyces pararoseus]
MSCCCASPAQALWWALGLNLLVFLPSAFYGLVEICFHYAEQEHQALSLVSTITCLGAVVVVVLGIIGRCTKNTTTLYAASSLPAICTAFATGATIWGASVATQARGLDLEGKILSAGTLVIVCVIFVLSPLVWLTYEVYAYRRQLQENGAAGDTQEEKSGRRSSERFGEMSASSSGTESSDDGNDQRARSKGSLY